MDYTSNPCTNQHPNRHDYDQLEAPRGRPILFERDLGGGDKQLTWVVWAEQPTAS